MTTKPTRKNAILRLIYDLGGEAKRAQINEKVPEYWELRKGELEIEKGVGKPLYWHHADSICHTLKKDNLVSLSGGVFRLTEAGKSHVDSLKAQNPNESGLAKELTAVQETSLRLEADLEDFLCRNLDKIEPGLRLHENGRQFNTSVGRVDILAADRAGGLIAIELKAGKAVDSALGQLLGYMSCISDELAKGKKVRGCIIANEFDGRIKRAVRLLPNVMLKAYKVNFSFEDVR